MIPIQVILKKKTTEKRAKHRLALIAVFDCVRLSGKQGIALRGHGDEKKIRKPLEFTVVGRLLQ